MKLLQMVNIHNRIHSPIGLSARSGRLPTGQRDISVLDFFALTKAVSKGTRGVMPNCLIGDNPSSFADTSASCRDTKNGTDE